MATFNTMAVFPTTFASTQALVIWPSVQNLIAELAVAPSVIGVVWQSEQEPLSVFSSLFTDPFPAEAVRIVDGSGGVAYRMRAYDATLGREVFWSSQGIDDTGNSYGGPGPLSDIVVHMLLGT